MGSARNMVRPLASQDWEATIYWTAMGRELAEISQRQCPEWLKLLLVGAGGGAFWGLLLGLGLAGVI